MKHVVESQTHLFRSPPPITGNFNSSNHPTTPARPTHIRTKEPSTAILLLRNIFVTILALEVFLERPTTYRSATNFTHPAMVDSVGESLPLRLALPPFHTIVIASENHKSSHLPDLPGQEVPMIPVRLSNQGCHIPTNLPPTISRLRVCRRHRHSPPTRTNTSITTYPTNPRSATARETVDHIQGGRTILWNETSPTTMSPPRLINSPHPSHLPGPRDLHPSKHRAFPVARIETGREFIITRGSAPRRT